IGSGILGIWNRSAATIAMAASTLHAVSGGRFVLGLGTSTPQLAEGLHDTPFERPVARMRRVVTQVRALLRGDRIPLAVTTQARAGAAWFVAFYLTTMGTIYRDSLTRQGYGKAVESVLAANAPKFAGAVPADAEELLEQLVVFGTPPDARRRLARWHAAGSTMPVLLMRPNLSPAEIALTLEAFRPMLESAHG